MSAILRMGQVTTTVMEPLYEGGHREQSIQKWSFQCLGCGLIWAIRWHAETCESRSHQSVWQQEYPSSRLDSYGKPYPPTSYPRCALGRADRTKAS